MRSSRVYRHYWYAKRRKSGSLRILAVLLSLLIILALLGSYAQKKVFPYIMEISEMKTRNLVAEEVESAIKAEFGRGLRYDDIAVIEKDPVYGVTSIKTNVNRLNALSSQITGRIREELFTGGRGKIGIPLGALSGNAIFSAEGPDVYVKFVSVGQVEANFKSDFTEAGVNQTRHTITMEVKVRVGIAIPARENQREISVEVPLAETIILGSPPEKLNKAVHINSSLR